jgi:hypothetical protein
VDPGTPSDPTLTVSAAAEAARLPLVQRLHCPTCGNEVFFDSLDCVRCRTALAMGVEGEAGIRVVDVTTAQPCSKRGTWGCNWPAVGPGAPLCRSCVLVDAGGREHDPLMIPFQSAQRRALYQLSRLGVPWGPGSELRFAYRSTAAGDDAVIGHRSGEITLDLDEADPARGESIRATLGEHYRTPLGHLRHELGHFVWLKLVASEPDRLGEFRELFGDERSDYALALDAHYGRADDGAWRDAFASFYASAHPWEDFAESWAQLMHVHDVVETGSAWGVVRAPEDRADAAAWLTTSITASVAANELARAMGMRDLYPFALTPGVRAKVEFCWRLLPVPVG